MPNKSRKSSSNSDLQEILSLPPETPTKIQFSHKTGLVTISFSFKGINCSFKLKAKDLETTWKSIASLPLHSRSFHLDGKSEATVVNWAASYRLFHRLSEALLEAYLQHSMTKARGDHAGRETFMLKIKYAASWAYLFIRQEYQKPEKNRHPALRRAEADLRKLMKEEFSAFRRPRDRHSLLTAHLILTAYENWDEKNLVDPFDADDFNCESFYQTYIKPLSPTIRGLARRHSDGLSPTTNAYLRAVLAPWNRRHKRVSHPHIRPLQGKLLY